jgi:predicted ATPase
VFRGGADLRAIAAVVAPVDEPGVEDPLDAIGGLVEASLVDVTEAPDGEPRLRLLETVRDYAHAKLTANGEIDVARERHARHYVDVAEEMSTQFVGAGYWAARAWFEAEDANLGEVFRWALPEGEPSPADPERLRSGLRLCKALSEWLVAYRPADGGKHLEKAL